MNDESSWTEVKGKGAEGTDKGLASVAARPQVVIRQDQKMF